MRRIISFIVMVCLLHTQTYSATYDGVDASSSSARQRGLVKQPVDLEAGGEAAESKPFGIDVVRALKHHAATLKQHVTAFVQTPLGFTLTFLAGTALVVYSLYMVVVGFMSWFNDIPFEVASKQLTHGNLSVYDSLDTCLNFLASGKELDRTRHFAHYDHATTSNGVSLLEAIPLWVNNATNIVSMLSTLVLAQRSVGQVQYGYLQKVESDFAKLLYAYGANIHQNYSCTFKLGETPATHTLTVCQNDPQKNLLDTSVDHASDDAGATVQVRRRGYKRGLKSPDDLRVWITLYWKTLRNQSYPVLDYSPDPNQLDEAACVSMQRRLLQLGNGLPLAAAVKDRVQNNLQIMAQLTAILSKLRFRETVDASDVAALSSLVRSVFTANQLALTSDVGCDAEFAGGQFNLLECFEGSSANVQTGAPVPDDAQVWFVRDWANAVSNVKIIANRAPVTEAMAVWLKQSPDAMHSLWVVANTLHQHVCNSTTDQYLELLRKAAQHQLRARNAYLQGDLGCDIRLSDDGIGEMVCHSGTAPVTNETCDLESDILVPWEGKLWLKPHALNPSLIDGTTVSVNPQWQALRSGTRAFSPSVLESPEVSESMSDSRTTYIPSRPNANTTQGNGITELYYAYYTTNSVRKIFFNATHKLNDTLFLSESDFGGPYPKYGLHIDKVRKRIFWTTINATNNQYKNIYVAELLSNPTRLNNTRIIYSSSSIVLSLYISNAVGRVFWTDWDGGIYMGNINITHPATITNVTSQSMITTTSYDPFGLYYHPQTQALLWSREEVSPSRYPIYISTVNFQTNKLINTSILLNGSYLRSISYDTKNQRIIAVIYGDLYMAPFSFENPKPLTNITTITTLNSYAIGISVVND